MSTANATAAPTEAIQPVRVGRWARARRRAVPYLFLSPFLIAFTVFVIVPLLWALNLSLYRSRLVGGRTFVGLDNYVRSLTDPKLWEGIRNVLTFGIIQIPIMLGLALLAALILDAGLVRRQTLYRIVLFLPFAVPAVVATLIWGYLYGQAFGPIAQIARFLGQEPPQFLTQGSIIPAMSNISTWQYTGYNYAALKAIPTELYEAARVDGASNVQIARRIKIPLVGPALVLTFIFSIIGTLQLFTEPYLLNAIAPSVIGPNFTPNRYVYNLSFQNRQFDYAAAISFMIALVTAILAGMTLLIYQRRGART
jgi:multiple sugar transport system permease protein